MENCPREKPQEFRKKSLEAYQTLVEQEIIPALERESDGELSKEEIHALATRLTETVEQYDEAIKQLNKNLSVLFVSRFAPNANCQRLSSNISAPIKSVFKNMSTSIVF